MLYHRNVTMISIRYNLRELYLIMFTTIIYFFLHVYFIFTVVITFVRFLVRALQLFCDSSHQGLPPLGGSIPDMVSTTGFFVSLQRIYQMRAAADRVIFSSLLLNVISESTRVAVPHSDMKMTRKSATDISADTVDIFCKNVFNLRSLSTRTFSEERTAPACDTLLGAFEDPFDDPPQVMSKDLGPSLQLHFPITYHYHSILLLLNLSYNFLSTFDLLPTLTNLKSLSLSPSLSPSLPPSLSLQTPIFFYIALRAADRFHAKHSRHPGNEDHQVRTDFSLFGRFPFFSLLSFLFHLMRHIIS